MFFPKHDAKLLLNDHMCKFLPLHLLQIVKTGCFSERLLYIKSNLYTSLEKLLHLCYRVCPTIEDHSVVEHVPQSRHL